jgi:hypothetical protein
VHERVAVTDIGGSIEALSANDLELAWRHAFRVDDLAGLGARVDGDVPFRVDTNEAAIALPARVRFAVAFPCAPRLDRVLAHTLCMSRSAIRARARAGLITAPANALRRPVRDDLVVNLRA